MRTSITITNFSWPDRSSIDEELGQVVRRADESGIDSVFVSDHLLEAEPGTNPEDPMLEAFTTLGYLAGQTERLRLGTMVAAATFRPPALLVKAVTTLDVLSRGRAWFGVGAGYHQGEADAMGLPLPPMAARFEWLEDVLELAGRMWSGNVERFDGRRTVATGPIASPRPASEPRPPILIGGMGETRTLRLVARYADACNLPDIPDGGATIRHKLAVLAAHCASEARSIDKIERTVSTRLEPGADLGPFVDHARELGTLGMDHLVVLTRGPWTTEALGDLAHAVPDITEIEPTPVRDVLETAQGS